MAPVIHKIFGGPGTGKTTRLLDLVAEEIEGGVPLKKIAYIAHTNAAADEAWDRLRSKMKLETKGRPGYFCTIHAAARRKTGWNTQKIWGWKQRDALAEMMNVRFGKFSLRDDEGELVPHGQPLVQCVNYMKARQCSLEEAMERFTRYEIVNFENVTQYMEAARAIKEESGTRDFDDILELYYSAPLPLECKVMFIDEAQDLSTLQWRIAEQMWADCDRVYICGDDDQAVYGFMGADPDGFLDYPCHSEEVLPRSWRVPRVIGAWAEKIISPVEKRKVKNLQWAEHEGIIETVFADRDTLPIDEQCSSTLILSRHQITAASIYRALSNQGIPVSLNGESYLTGKEARAAATFFRLEKGESVSINEALVMMKEVPGREDSVRRINEMRGGDYKKGKAPTFTKDQFSFNWNGRLGSNLGQTLIEQDIYDSIDLQVRRHGVDVLFREPSIRVMTMHASKGREAEHVIVMTECFGSVWIEQDGPSQDTERKLSYVAATRSKKRLTLVHPNSEFYCRFLVET